MLLTDPELGRALVGPNTMLSEVPVIELLTLPLLRNASGVPQFKRFVEGHGTWEEQQNQVNRGTCRWMRMDWGLPKWAESAYWAFLATLQACTPEEEEIIEGSLLPPNLETFIFSELLFAKNFERLALTAGLSKNLFLLIPNVAGMAQYPLKVVVARGQGIHRIQRKMDLGCGGASVQVMRRNGL